MRKLFINGAPSGLVEGLIVEDGRILQIDSTSNLIRAKGPDDSIVDLQGGFVYPGFIESHAHILATGAKAAQLDLSVCRSFKDLESKIVRAKPNRGDWILGRGWDQTLWTPPVFPSRTNLTQNMTHPFYLLRTDCHAAFVNAEALNRAGVTASTPDPDGGVIVRDESGKPTGLLIDHAMNLVSAIIDEPTRAEKSDYARNAQRIFHAQGVTSVHDAGTLKEDFDIFKNLEAERYLTMRIYCMGYLKNHDAAVEFFKEDFQTPTSFLKMKAIKLFCDGALGSRGAAFLEPYCDDPRNKGLILLDEDEMTAICRLAYDHDFQVCVHAIGDRANRQVLDCFEQVLNGEKRRWRIEHAQIISPADIPRFQKLGVIASQQPIHCTSDMRFAEDRLGHGRCKHGAYSWRSLWNTGACVAFGSDSPIEWPSVIRGIHAAVTRQDDQGRPHGGWFPQECLSCAQALKAYTENGAYASFEESVKGNLHPGQFADFVVLNQDLLNCDRILNTVIQMTVVNGEVVYQI